MTDEHGGVRDGDPLRQPVDPRPDLSVDEQIEAPLNDALLTRLVEDLHATPFLWQNAAPSMPTMASPMPGTGTLGSCRCCDTHGFCGAAGLGEPPGRLHEHRRAAHCTDRGSSRHAICPLRRTRCPPTFQS